MGTAGVLLDGSDQVIHGVLLLGATVVCAATSVGSRAWAADDNPIAGLKEPADAEAFAAFEGGFGTLLWRVHCLDIIDKHNVLLTVASGNTTHSMPPSVIERYKGGLGLHNEYSPAQEALIFQTESLARFPLEAGGELARVPITDVNENMSFMFALAFGEPKAVAGAPIIQTLFQTSGFIRDMIRTFDGLGLFA